MLTWAYADFGRAALALALLVLLLGLHVGRSRQVSQRLGLGVGRLAWKLPLRLAAGLLLLLAWLGPVLGVRPQAVRSSGQDVWLLVDVSRSMDAADVAPTRLLRTQAALTELAAAFPADRLGLIAFNSEAVVQCPLTYDQSALRVFLSTLSTKALTAGPTMLRAPLELLLSRLNPTPASGGPPRTVAAVVVSDGEDFGENLESVLQAVGRTGARVYTVGVGTAAGAPVPAPGGGASLRDAQGRPVVSRLREAPLLQIAAQTGGQYVPLNDRENGLPTLLASMRSQPPPTTATTRTITAADNRYRYPLGIALVVLLVDSLLTVRVLRLDL